MYETIMVPTDCSGFDREAVRVGLRIAERTKATLHLVRVRTINGFIGTGAAPDGAEFPMALNLVLRPRDVCSRYAVSLCEFP